MVKVLYVSPQKFEQLRVKDKQRHVVTSYAVYMVLPSINSRELLHMQMRNKKTWRSALISVLMG